MPLFQMTEPIEPLIGGLILVIAITIKSARILAIEPLIGGLRRNNATIVDFPNLLNPL